jgi:hypothetical protein
MAVLPGVLACWPLRRTAQVRLGTNTLRLPGTRRKRLRCAWPTHFRGLATSIHETSGLGITMAEPEDAWNSAEPGSEDEGIASSWSGPGGPRSPFGAWSPRFCLGIWRVARSPKSALERLTRPPWGRDERGSTARGACSPPGSRCRTDRRRRRNRSRCTDPRSPSFRSPAPRRPVWRWLPADRW